MRFQGYEMQGSIFLGTSLTDRVLQLAVQH